MSLSFASGVFSRVNLIILPLRYLRYLFYIPAMNKGNPPPLGRIGQLAEELRRAARAVTDDMVTSPGGDAYEYRGSTMSVEWLLTALNDLEHFQAGWRA